MIDSGLGWLAQQICIHQYGRGTTRAEDAQEAPSQSPVSPSILVYEDYRSRIIMEHPESEPPQKTTLTADKNTHEQQKYFYELFNQFIVNNNASRGGVARAHMRIFRTRGGVQGRNLEPRL